MKKRVGSARSADLEAGYMALAVEAVREVEVVGEVRGAEEGDGEDELGCMYDGFQALCPPRVQWP